MAPRMVRTAISATRCGALARGLNPPGVGDDALEFRWSVAQSYGSSESCGLYCFVAGCLMWTGAAIHAPSIAKLDNNVQSAFCWSGTNLEKRFARENDRERVERP